MAILNNQVRKVPDLPQLNNVSDNDVVLIHSGDGLKKVLVSTLKRLFSTRISVATSSSNGIMRPDNTTTEVNNGAIKAKTATRGSVGVVKPDGSTINISNDGTISVNSQALSSAVVSKVTNQNGNTEMKFWVGSKKQYDAIVTKDPHTVYDCWEEEV